MQPETIKLLKEEARACLKVIATQAGWAKAALSRIRDTARDAQRRAELEAIWEGSFSVKQSRVKELQRRQGVPSTNPF
jgi:hypothetical protein